MDLLPILKFPNDTLKKPVIEVSEFNEELKTFIKKMKHTVSVYNALGLAAPQVGRSESIIVCNLTCGMTVMINPQIRNVATSIVRPGFGEAYEKTSIKEGCLSVPGVYSDVLRYKNIEVKWQDEQGYQHRSYFSDKDAVIIQHEVDHLNGVLFLDRLGAIRSMVLQKYFKKNRK